MSDALHFELTIATELAGERLDKVLSGLLPQFSRGRIQAWLKAGLILVDGQVQLPKAKVLGGEHVIVDAQPDADESEVQAQAIALDIVYEDEDLLVINKPAGLVVHPAAGHRDQTLQNALLYHCETLRAIPRAGIVHRLDKLTSGLLVVAKTLTAHKSLVEQLAAKTVYREYWAIVNGVMAAGGTVDAPIGRHPVDRKKQAISQSGKPAVSHYRVKERYRQHSLVTVQLETGRTHQIRVHLSSIHYPLVGDPVYGARLKIPPQASAELTQCLRHLKRQALHAHTLGLQHPTLNESMEFSVAPPQDFLDLMQLLQQDTYAHAAE